MQNCLKNIISICGGVKPYVRVMYTATTLNNEHTVCSRNKVHKPANLLALPQTGTRLPPASLGDAREDHLHVLILPVEQRCCRSSFMLQQGWSPRHPQGHSHCSGPGRCLVLGKGPSTSDLTSQTSRCRYHPRLFPTVSIANWDKMICPWDRTVKCGGPFLGPPTSRTMASQGCLVIHGCGVPGDINFQMPSIFLDVNTWIISQSERADSALWVSFIPKCFCQ